MDKLKKLKEKALKDKSLPFSKSSKNLVFGDGNPDAEIYFLGEAPGKFEDLKGLPFVGQAGKILDEILKHIGLKRDEVFITSVLWYRPPKNRDPKSEEIQAFQPYINKQIKIIKPKVIVTLGRFSLNKFLPDAKISEIHGKPQKIKWEGLDLIIIPMYHPAAALYRRDKLEVIKKDFVQIKKFILN